MTIYKLCRAFAFPSLNGRVVGVAPDPRIEQEKAASLKVRKKQIWMDIKSQSYYTIDHRVLLKGEDAPVGSLVATEVHPWPLQFREALNRAMSKEEVVEMMVSWSAYTVLSSLAYPQPASTEENYCQHPLTHLTDGEQPPTEAWYPQKV